MTQKININGTDHGLDTLSDDAKKIIVFLQVSDEHILEIENLLAIFTRAKTSYISDLKREIIKGKSGVDIASLFD